VDLVINPDSGFPYFGDGNQGNDENFHTPLLTGFVWKGRALINLKAVFFYDIYFDYSNLQPIPSKHEQVIQSFTIQIDPMERVLLVNFEKDRDEVYLGFEPQVFDDDKNGKGHLIIGWLVDGRVDVYHQHSLHLDRAKYDIAGKGLANMISGDMKPAEYEVDDFGVQAHYQFRDLQNRTVEIRINENNTKKRKPFGLLAPMGNAAE
jgi:hypothetical protein